MPEVVPERNPVKVRAGRMGGRARWGEPRVLRLDTLPPSVRAGVLALVEAERNAREREAGEPEAA